MKIKKRGDPCKEDRLFSFLGIRMQFRSFGLRGDGKEQLSFAAFDQDLVVRMNLSADDPFGQRILDPVQQGTLQGTYAIVGIVPFPYQVTFAVSLIVIVQFIRAPLRLRSLISRSMMRNMCRSESGAKVTISSIRLMNSGGKVRSKPLR